MNLPVGRDQIARLIPHQGEMCLWDEVLDWDADVIHLRTARHRDPRNPLRSHDCLRAVHLCEYGAQAMAVHGGLLAQAAGSIAPPGMLVALRGIELHIDRIDQLGGDLEAEARMLIGGDSGWQYSFRLSHVGQLLAEGRAAVMPQPVPAS